MTVVELNKQPKRGITFLKRQRVIVLVVVYTLLFTAVVAAYVYKKNKIQSLGAKKNNLISQRVLLEKELKLKLSEFKSKVNSSNVEELARIYLKMEKSKSPDGVFVVVDVDNIFINNEDDQLPDLFCDLTENSIDVIKESEVSNYLKKENIY